MKSDHVKQDVRYFKILHETLLRRKIDLLDNIPDEICNQWKT